MLTIACDSEFETLSVSDYLQKYHDYKHKKFEIEYPGFEEGKYFNICRFKVQAYKDVNSFLMKISSTSDNNMLKYLRYKIFEVPKDSSSSYMLKNHEGIHKNE